MKNWKKKIEFIALVVSLFIVCVMLVISLSYLFFPDTDILNELIPRSHEGPEYQWYELDVKQNNADYSFIITIGSRSGKKIPANSSYLYLDELVNSDQTKSLSIDDYETSQVFFEHIGVDTYCLNGTDKQINFSKNISITISYFDVDGDSFLSKNDYFLINFFDLNNNHSYNLSQFQYKEYDFYIEDDQNNMIGYTRLNKLPPNPNIKNETISSPGTLISLSICILYLIILLVLHLYFIMKIIKNRRRTNKAE